MWQSRLRPFPQASDRSCAMLMSGVLQFLKLLYLPDDEICLELDLVTIFKTCMRKASNYMLETKSKSLV